MDELEKIYARRRTMATLWMLVLAACLLLYACYADAARLRVTGTAPVGDNGGTCADPVLVTYAGPHMVVVHVRYSGPRSGEDSVAVLAGSPFIIEHNVPAGWYSVTAWASDSGGVGCDTTAAMRAHGPPWKPKL